MREGQRRTLYSRYHRLAILRLFDIRNISEYISGMQVLGKLPIKAMDMFLRTKPIKPFCSYHVLNFWTSEGLRSYKLCSYKKNVYTKILYTSPKDYIQVQKTIPKDYILVQKTIY